VFDQDTSEPLSGADVVAFESRKKETHAPSDESGRYRMENVGNPSGEVAARLEGYAISQKGQFSYSHNQFVIRQTLPENSDAITADIPMVPVVYVSGRVENQDGLPVGGAKVEWASSLAHGSSGEATNSNSDGQFRFQVLPFQDGLVQVTASAYARKRSDPIKVANKDVNDIVIVLGPGASVSGRVVNPRGEGVPDASVTSENGYYSLGGFLRGDTVTERSGVDGQFLVENLAPAEKLKLRATADDFAPGSTTVAIEAGEHKTGVEIKLEEQLTIEGRVLDSDDKPVMAYVVPNLSGIVNRADKTDANGHFKVTGLPKGQVTLTAYSEDMQQHKNATVEAGAKDVIIRLGEKTMVTVHGKVVDGTTQRPIEDFTVSGVSKEARDGEGPGGFRFSASPKYTSFLRIASKGYATQGFEVKVDQDQQEVNKTFALGIGSGVTGRIVNRDGKPIPSTAVVVYDQRPYQNQGDMVGNSVSGEDGRFTISKVPAGKVRVAAMPEVPLAPVYKQVELKDGEFTDVGDMVIEQMGAIHVTAVRGAAEEPMEGQMVYLNGTGALTEYRVVNTGADGGANFEKLSPGTYELKIASHIERVELASGESKSVVMRLGNVQLTGKVLTGGKADYNTLQLRQVESGYTTKNFVSTNYVVSNLPPGDYEATIFEGMDRSYDDTNTSAAKMLHQELFNVPDQPTVTKDFVVP
jgi:hypothetical protein